MEKRQNRISSEEITNAISHGIGLVLAVVALVILVVVANHSGDFKYLLSFTIYGSTLVILYLFSTLYHSFQRPKLKNIFKVLDHISIYLFIAGTYTPIALITLRGKLGWTMLGIVWSIAIVGTVFKIFCINKFKILSLLLYLAMGWLIVIAIKPLLVTMNRRSIIFLISGGLLYTIGTIFYSWKNLKYNHAIWHFFVLGGSVCHFFTVLFLVP